MVFWIVLANNENVIYREKLASKMNLGFAGLLSVFAISMYVLKGTVSFIDVIIGLYLLVTLAIAIQFYILYKYKGIKLTKTMAVSAVIFVFSLMVIL